MPETQLRLIHNSTKCAKIIGESIRQSPKCTVEYDFEIVPHMTEPNFLYIDIVDQEYDRPWNIHCVLTSDSPREICYKLIKFCPEIFCLNYGDFEKD